MLLAFALAARTLLTPIDTQVPIRQPQLAVSGDEVAMAYGSGNAVYFRKSIDKGATFSAPVLVGQTIRLALGMHRGPRIAYAGKAVVISAIAGASAKGGSDGDLLSWRSTDGGVSWSKAIVVNDVVSSAREGLHGMAASSKGVVFSTWLDLRAKGTKLYGSVSKNGGATWSPNMLVYESPDGSICQCCHPTAFVSESGELRVMWRNAIAGSRDMYTAVSNDDGRNWTSAKVGKGTWELKACPMDGGGVSVDSRKVVHTAWRRDGAIFTTTGNGEEKQVGSGKNPAIVSGKAGEYLVWNDGTALKLARPGSKEPEIIAPEGGFAVLAGSGPVYAAWEEKGSIGFARIE